MAVDERSRGAKGIGSRPVFAQPVLILLVFFGGAIGATARLSLELLMPWTNRGVPWAIVVANLGGAFALGLLLSALARRGPENRVRRDLRLFVGTGVLGGFTTYSSFATDVAILLEPQAAVGVLFSVLMVLTGLIAAGLGVWLDGVFARWFHLKGMAS